MIRVLYAVDLILVIACVFLWVVLNLAERRQRRRANRAARYVADLYDVLPLTPLPANPRVYKRPAWVPRIRRDIPEQCWCGEGPRWHYPQYVTDALHHATVAETMNADSMQFPAVTL